MRMREEGKASLERRHAIACNLLSNLFRYRFRSDSTSRGIGRILYRDHMDEAESPIAPCSSLPFNKIVAHRYGSRAPVMDCKLMHASSYSR
jgi:hypothetical protein